VLLHDVPVRSERSFCVSEVCRRNGQGVFVVITMWPRPRAAALSHALLRPVRVQADRPASSEVNSVPGEGITAAVIVAGLASLS
jgi:hypothetical protein